MNNMVFWLFKKRVDNSEDINIKLHHSFSNIKKDMIDISEWISHFKTKHNNHDERYETLNKEINNLKEEIKYLKSLFITHYQQSKEEAKTNTQEGIEEIFQPIPQEKILDSLTITQKELLKALARITHEHDIESVSLKDIKEEYYPNKSYSEVRTTISQYLDILIELGLILKKRKGRQTYVSLTEKGKRLFPNYKKELELKSKAKKNNESSI